MARLEALDLEGALSYETNLEALKSLRVVPGRYRVWIVPGPASPLAAISGIWEAGDDAITALKGAGLRDEIVIALKDFGRRPLAGASIRATPEVAAGSPLAGLVARCETDEAGECALRLEPGLVYRAEADPAPRAGAPRAWFTIEPGRRPEAREVVVGLPAIVRGSVGVERSGRLAPVPGLLVELIETSADGEPRVVGAGQTLSDGRFSIVIPSEPPP